MSELTRDAGKVTEVLVVLPVVGKDVADHLHNGKTLDDLIPWETLPRLKTRNP